MLRLWTTIALLAGLAVVAVLVALQGYQSVADELAALGWGIGLLPLAFLPSLVLIALSWRLLFRPGRLPRLGDLLRAVWMAFSVDTLLPLGGFGGDVVRVRVLMQGETRGTDAGASVVVNKTVDAIAIVLSALIGVVFLVAIEAEDELVSGALIASALLAFGIAGFIFVQHAGTFGFLARRFGGTRRAGSSAEMIENAVSMDATIRALYGGPGRIALSVLVRLLARLVLTVELWLAIALMGQTITLWDALMLRSLIGALRSAAFFVPGGWGLQEGSFVILGGLIGFPPDIMLALSLATRVRELVVSVPGLLAWQHTEGRALWKRHAAARRR